MRRAGVAPAAVVDHVGRAVDSEATGIGTGIPVRRAKATARRARRVLREEKTGRRVRRVLPGTTTGARRSTATGVRRANSTATGVRPRISIAIAVPP
jgi:hypothetical protein